MCNRSWIYALPLTILFALQASTTHGQEAIGKATSVRPQAEGSHAGPLSGGSNVYSKETVRTGDTGQADLQFHDHSNLSVGPKSSVRLDKFVYDPNKSAGTIAIQATRGSFRFVTGSQGKGAVQVRHPMEPWACAVDRKLNRALAQRPTSNSPRCGMSWTMDDLRPAVQKCHLKSIFYALNYGSNAPQCCCR